MAAESFVSHAYGSERNDVAAVAEARSAGGLSNRVAISQAVVLAGGLGTRLGERGLLAPKILQPICQQPFVKHLLRRFTELGIESVHLCLGHKSSEVVAYLRASSPSLYVTYSIDSEPQGGTAAALRSARPHLGGRFLVWMGDTYAAREFSLPAALDAPMERPAMVLTGQCADIVPNATLAVDGMVSYRKAGSPEFDLIDTGVAYMDVSFLDLPEFRHHAHLEDCWASLSARRMLAGYRTSAAFFDIGTPGRIRALERHLR